MNSSTVLAPWDHPLRWLVTIASRVGLEHRARLLDVLIWGWLRTEHGIPDDATLRAVPFLAPSDPPLFNRELSIQNTQREVRIPESIYCIFLKDARVCIDDHKALETDKIKQNASLAWSLGIVEAYHNEATEIIKREQKRVWSLYMENFFAAIQILGEACSPDV